MKFFILSKRINPWLNVSPVFFLKGATFLVSPFDPSKLKFNVIEFFGEKLIDSVFYCGEEVSLELKGNMTEEHLMDIFKGACFISNFL